MPKIKPDQSLEDDGGGGGGQSSWACRQDIIDRIQCQKSEAHGQLYIHILKIGRATILACKFLFWNSRCS